MPDQPLQQLAFGDFVLDPGRGRLRKAGNDVSLRPQTFQVLSLLAAHRGELVSKDTLLDVVWRGASVTDGSLTQCIVELRKAIGDSSHSIIRTVPRRGFIFDPPLAAAPEPVADQSIAASLQRALPRPVLTIAVLLCAAAAATAALVNLRPDVPDPLADVLQTHTSAYTIAVLPFADMSAGQDQQYFGDGIADEIISKLSEHPELEVIARTSSFMFRDRPVDTTAIGRRLNAAHVLEGSVRKSGKQVRITAHLIETAGGTQVWSQPYDRELTVNNLLDIQSEVAASVAEIISGDSSVGARQARWNQRPASAHAYDLYLQGMYYLHRFRTDESAYRTATLYDAATAAFERAIEIDPAWAPAYAGLGRVYHFRAGALQDDGDPEAWDWYELSKQRLLEAVRLDPEYALAYSSLGHVLYRLDLDFDAASAAFDRARELGGYFPWAYALYLAKVGRLEESLQEYRLAIERDPLAIGPRHQLATVYHCAGREADAIEQLETALGMAPHVERLYLRLAYLYLKTGRTEDGARLFEQYADPETPSIDHGEIYAMMGMPDKARALLGDAGVAYRGSLHDLVSVSLVLGEKTRAMGYLQSAADDDPRWLIDVLCIRGISSLVDEPQFRRLLRDAGFPDQAIRSLYH